MCFRLGAILVKGGKIYSRGFNHQRPQYDGPSSSRSYCTAVVSTSLSSGPRLALKPATVDARRAARDLQPHGPDSLSQAAGCVRRGAQATCSTWHARPRRRETARTTRCSSRIIMQTGIIMHTTTIHSGSIHTYTLLGPLSLSPRIGPALSALRRTGFVEAGGPRFSRRPSLTACARYHWQTRPSMPRIT
jgi:hypothetical protein